MGTTTFLHQRNEKTHYVTPLWPHIHPFLCRTSRKHNQISDDQPSRTVSRLRRHVQVLMRLWTQRKLLRGDPAALLLHLTLRQVCCRCWGIYSRSALWKRGRADQRAELHLGAEGRSVRAIHDEGGSAGRFGLQPHRVDREGGNVVLKNNTCALRDAENADGKVSESGRPTYGV